MPRPTLTMTDTIKALAEEASHASHYAAIRRDAPHIPKWEDLSHDQRARIRDENRRYWQELRDFADEIRRTV